MREFISFEEAREIVLGAVESVDHERIALSEALKRTLAEDIEAEDDIPPFDNSAMDGFAVRAADASEPGARLRCVGEIAAGVAPTQELRSGTCVAIMTGAPIPNGADAVIPIEETDRDGDVVRFNAAATRADNVRPAGGDLRKGDSVIKKGAVVTPGTIAVMASLGYASIAVSNRVRVGVVTTGSELIDVEERLGPGQIRDSNGPTLAALVECAGGTVRGPWRARDNRAEIRSRLERALEADLLVVSGGVSVGEYDLVKEELDALGMKLLFWKVRQRPGKPLAFGLIGKKPVFGLPGNPVSSAVCFEQYVRPAIAKMLGRTSLTRPFASATLSAPVAKKKGLYTFARGFGRYVDGGLVVDPAKHQGSHVASSLAFANGLIHLPEELDEAPEGLRVDFEYLDW